MRGLYKTKLPQANSLQKTGFKQWLKRHRRALIIALLVIASLTVVAVFVMSRGKQQPNIIISEPTISANQAEQKIYSPLSGVAVSQNQAERPVTAVIIENHSDARPQSGLSEAGVIYEAIAEGGITRFAALYQENTPQELGPVRSLRPYFLDWLRPFNPTVAHVGGSKKALSQVRDGTWKDMDQFANGKSFWRSKDRKAPHNVYTSFELIDKFNQSKDYKLEDFSSFARKEDQKSSAPNSSDIKLNVSSGNYNVSYTYSPDDNAYLRYQGSGPHLEKNGKQIEPKVVLALISNYSIVQEDGSRSSYQTSGSGKAFLFQDGSVQEVEWSKPNQTSPLILKDSAGQEVKLNRGQTWITVLASKDKLSWQ